MPRLPRPLVPLMTLLLLLVPVRAGATIARAVTFDEKVENAASIVLGKCVRQEARWDDAKKWILTYSTFEVEKAYKGGSPGQLTIVTPGGRVDNVAQEVIGMPRFEEGEDHVLFVRNSQAGPTVLYLEQGAYKVEAGERGERRVQPLTSNAVLVDSQRGVAVAPERPRTLREFETNLRDTVTRNRAQQMELAAKKKREESSIWNQLRRNSPLVLLAIVGAALATWQLMKRN
jgi:hypothetical protein